MQYYAQRDRGHITDRACGHTGKAKGVVESCHHRVLPTQGEQCGSGPLRCTLPVVSVRREEKITEALWGSEVSPSTISELNKRGVPTLRVGVTVLCKAGDIRTSMLMGSICAVTGVRSLKM